MISSEHLGLAYSFDFQFVDKPDFWLSADVTVNEAFQAIKTGLLRNQQISKVKAFAITQGETSVSFIYDVNAAKSGNFPWSLSPN